MIMVFISAAKNYLVKTSAYYLGDLWADSILGEYDSKLYSRYGILAFYGNEEIVESKIRFYMNYTYGDKNYANVNVNNVSLYDHSIIKEENFLKQIKTLGALDILKKLGAEREDGSFIRYQNTDGTSGEPRIVTSGSAINALPSSGRTNDGILDQAGEFLKSIGSVKDVIKEGTDSYLINSYIKTYFRNIYTPGNEESYLYGEQEYIVGGKFSDEANRKAIRNRIIGMREVMNLFYLEQDEEKRALALAAGETITLGTGGEPAAQVIMAAWALAESVNDYELLIRGKAVPVMKDASCWAIDLDSILNNEEKGCVDTGNRKGDYYEDYLQYMMYFLSERTRLLRIMDLIQINMKYTYRGNFLLSEYYDGLEYGLDVNGEKYTYVDEY